MKALLLIMSLILIAPVHSQAEMQFECGPGGGGGGMPPIQGMVKAYIVYVSYPGDVDSLILPSADATISTLTNWLPFASNGRQSFNLSVLRRLDHPERAWKLGSQPDYPCPAPRPDVPRCDYPCQYDANLDRCVLRPEMTTYIDNSPVANLDVFRRIYNHYKVP